MSSRRISLLPRATLHSDSEHERTFQKKGSIQANLPFSENLEFWGEKLFFWDYILFGERLLKYSFRS
jgi:hypothetical protein